MDAVKAILGCEPHALAYGPGIIKKSGLSSTTVYGSLAELTAHGMLEHRYHGGPYYLTEKTR